MSCASVVIRRVYIGLFRIASGVQVESQQACDGCSKIGPEFAQSAQFGQYSAVSAMFHCNDYCSLKFAASPMSGRSCEQELEAFIFRHCRRQL